MNEPLPVVAGLPVLAVEAYERGIGADHVLWHLIAAVWVDGVNVTERGIVWLDLAGDLALAVRLGGDREGPRVTGTDEIRGHIDLEVRSDIFSAQALAQFEMYYPELDGHVHRGA